MHELSRTLHFINVDHLVTVTVTLIPLMTPAEVWCFTNTPRLNLVSTEFKTWGFGLELSQMPLPF